MLMFIRNLNHRLAQFAATTALLATSASAQTAVSVSGGRLSLTTPGGNQSVKVEVSGSGLARVFGFPGIADGTPYGGLSGVTVTTGAGNNKVEFELLSSQSFDVRVDTGSGQAETKVKWKILAGGLAPAANLAVLGTEGQTRLVEVDLESESNRAAVSIDTGSANQVAAKVVSANASEFLRVAFAAAAPRTSLEVGSNASALEVDVRGGATPAADELMYKIMQGRRADVNLNWAIDTGAGDDKVEALVSTSGSTVTQRGSVLTRAGNDTVQFETDAFSTVTGLTINGGLGADLLSQVIKGRFQSSQTLRTSMLGGDGDDELILTTDTGIFGTGLPNDTFPLIDCGLGTDRFNAFGLIRGCESRL
jgi:hypothetical protein